MVFAVRIFLMSIDGYFQCVLECSFSSGGTWLEVLLLSMTTVKTQKGHSSWPLPREDTGTAAAVIFIACEGLRWMYSHVTITPQSYRTAAFPPHTIPVSCEDVACACLLLHLLAFLSPAQELPNIYFGEYSCKMTKADIKSPFSLEELFTLLFYFISFFSSFFFFFFSKYFCFVEGQNQRKHFLHVT